MGEKKRHADVDANADADADAGYKDYHRMNIMASKRFEKMTMTGRST